jgi:hypothetical protein
MSSNLRSRMRRVGAIAAFTLLAAGALTTTPALASSACPNEQVRQESNTNPATGQPYSLGLPECRAYEMVTPPEKGGSDALSRELKTAGAAMPAAADGDAFEFASQNAFGDAEYAKAGAFGQPADFYVARRGAEGWSTSSASPPRAVIPHAGLFRDASPEAFSTVSTCGLTPEVNNAGAGSSAVCALRESGGHWTSTPFYPNLTGSVYGNSSGDSGITYRGASANLTDLVFASQGGPGSAFLPADTSLIGGGTGLYEVTRSGDTAPELSLINVNDSGEEIGPEAATQLGGVALVGKNVACGGSGVAVGSAYQAISSSGSTIYFTACPSGGVETVYARINRASTVAISNPSPSQCTACTAAASPASFEGASADGSKAFFITDQPLVNGDEGGTGTGADLYEYDFANPPGKNLVQLSAGGAGDLTPGSGAEVQGVVRTSSDGSHVYFVAKGVLTTVPNGVGEVAQAGADNLYAVNTDTDETKFVAELCSNASLSGSVSHPQCPATLNGTTPRGINDTELWGVSGSLGQQSAQATPAGRYLVFTTYAKLITTGPEADTNEAQQVYRYDFETARLTRISIGEPSFPGSHNGNTPGMNASVTGLPTGGSDGGNGAFADINDLARAISEDGATIVFTTPEQLQANDVNTGSNPLCHTRHSLVEPEASGCNVYAWHECTSGACGDGMSGEVSMISPGIEPKSASVAAGMSASGSDIFFFTRTPLVGQDTDSLIDVYDARIGGGFPAPTPEPSCSGESCQGAPSGPPSLGSSGTSSFTGGGNVTPGSTSFPALAEAGKVSIAKYSVKGSTISLSVKTPTKGRVSASGSGVATMKRSVSTSGTYVLKLTLTRAGKASLRKGHRLKIEIKVAFTPASGQASSATITSIIKT